MSPYQHGEVFVTDDGCETDLDLGHYERFIDKVYRDQIISLQVWSIGTSLLRNERGLLGSYCTNCSSYLEIKARITQTLNDNDSDIIITEIGGTVGDIESLPFIEAIRQFQYENENDCVHVHLTLVYI